MISRSLRGRIVRRILMGLPFLVFIGYMISKLGTAQQVQLLIIVAVAAAAGLGIFGGRAIYQRRRRRPPSRPTKH